MKKLLMCVLAAILMTPAIAQEIFEQGKPNDDNYRYLDKYKALKEYIDYTKYPNFKLGATTTVNDYLNISLVKNLINYNFTETVAANAMKMNSCVDGNGNMDFSTVKKFVNAASEAGINVYGHTLAWHSQQPKGWLKMLLADKTDPNGEEVYTEVASKDFRQDHTINWKSDEAEYGYTLSFEATNGMKVVTTKSKSWEIQFLVMDNIMLETGRTYRMTFTVKGSKTGELVGRLGDWNDGSVFTINFNKDWQEVAVDIKPIIMNNFIILRVPNYIGEVYLKTIKIEGNKGTTIPQTKQEMHDTLVYAMDKWIKGMMEACDGKVKAWDVVNQAISGSGNDGQGNYELQHSEGYKSGTLEIGDNAFYWQDYMGDLEYVRQACRLARKYGPEDIKLFINDYDLESDWDDNKKVKSLVNWIKKWEADGVTKIDGIGTGMHINCFEDASILNNIKSHITNMFQIMAASGKLVRVSELDMGYIRGSNRWGNSVKTTEMTEAEHKKMADFYEWIISEYFRIIPPEQQWGICQWSTNDAPSDSGWRAGEPIGIWDQNNYRKHVYAGFVRGLNDSKDVFTVSIKAVGNGTVSYNNTAVKNKTIDFSVNEGVPVTIMLTPDEGYRVKSLIVNNTDVTSSISNNQYTISNISANTNVVAEFEIIPPTTYTLSIKASGNGSVRYGDNSVRIGTNSFTVIEGTSVDLILNPDDGHLIKSFVVNNTDVTSNIVDNQYTISNINNDITVEVQFQAIEAITYSGMDFIVTSTEQKEVVVAKGDYGLWIKVPETVSAYNLTWTVIGFEEGAIESATELAAVIWNPQVKFKEKVTNPNMLLYVKSADYAPTEVKNVIVDGKAKSITLNDAASGNNFYCPQEFTAEQITYEHNYSMKTGYSTCQGWESIVLPFDVAVVTNNIGTELVPYTQWTLGDSKRPFWLCSMNEDGWKNESAIKANTPYIISMPNNDNYDATYNITGNIVFSASNVTVHTSDNLVSSKRGHRNFVPNYQNTDRSSDIYALNVNNLWSTNTDSNLAEGSAFIRDSRQVRPFEAYMTIDSGGGTTRSISIFDDDDTTGIMNLPLACKNKDGVLRVYSLSGMLLKQGKDEKILNDLPKGVYVVNGKKIIK